MKQQSVLNRLPVRQMVLTAGVVLPVMVGLAVFVVTRDVWNTFNTSQRLSWLSALLVATIAALILTYWVTRRALRPVRKITVAALAAAQGDLDQKVTVQGGAELVALAQAFNTMTEQIQNLVSHMGNLVAERTAELAQRAEATSQSERQSRRRIAQLEASAKVARSVASMLDTDQLLEQAVASISEAFGH